MDLPSGNSNNKDSVAFKQVRAGPSRRRKAEHGEALKPYYQEDGITIYCGDARAILPLLPAGIADAIICDPPWPNCSERLAGADDPLGLFQAAAKHFSRLAKRLVIQLGEDSDPRFLSAVPPEWQFLRVCWLQYPVSRARGYLRREADVAYAYGPPPKRSPWTIIPGRTVASDSKGHCRAHPCARKLEHAAFQIRWFAVGPVLDPFMGSGTVLLAAKQLGLPAIGIEIEERYCAVAVKHLAQGMLKFE
jgi:site-specific DNA-methyltransferase (adenine-specific)